VESIKANPKIAELLTAWRMYLNTVEDWQMLIKGAKAHTDGCGKVYELPNPIARENESFAIADMRGLEFSDPHGHVNDEFETYFVLEGSGKVAVGDKIVDIRPGLSLVTPPNTPHGTYSLNKDLVVAVINTPPFNPDNCMPLSGADAKEMQRKLKP
jgi:mannose-6-phosphate isomerase-like protein (cupin superfamily)